MGRNTKNKGPVIKCKDCNRSMRRLEWMQNTDCTNPKCRCPQVKKAREVMHKVINDAQEGSKTRLQTEWHDVPHNLKDSNNQLYVNVPEVMTIVITPVRGK